jgi:hypothetical protein
VVLDVRADRCRFARALERAAAKEGNPNMFANVRRKLMSSGNDLEKDSMEWLLSLSR